MVTVDLPQAVHGTHLQCESSTDYVKRMVTIDSIWVGASSLAMAQRIYFHQIPLYILFYKSS